MKAELFEALDRAMKAGTEKALKPAQIAGKGADAQHEILKELCASGFLASTVKGKNTTYTVTEAGKTEYERQNAPEHLETRERAQQRAAILTFLKAVEQTGKLSAKDKKSIPDSVVEEAKSKRLVIPGKKADTYELQVGGETILFGEKSADVQIASLKKLSAELRTKLEGAQQKVKQELEPLHGEGGTDVKSTFAATEEQAKSVAEALTKVIDQITAYSTFAAAALKFQREIEESRNKAMAELKLEAEKSKAQDQIERKIVHEIKQIEDELKHLSQRIAIIEKTHESASHKAHHPAEKTEEPAAHPHGSHSHKHEAHAHPPEDAVWKTAHKEYERLQRETIRLGGLVNIPDLTDAIRAGHSDLSVKKIHEILMDWEKQDKLTLQICSTPDQEPRAQEGIHSQRGLLFYIAMRG